MKRRRQSGGFLSSLLATALVPTALSKSLFQDAIDSYTTRTYDPNNPAESCFEKLWNADADGDGILQNSEYTTFVSELSEGDFDEDNYVDLPFVLKVNFVYLSCLCSTRPEYANTGDDCCKGPEGGIYVSGADPNGITLSWEEEYLRTVCSETQGAIDYARIEAGITASPTKEPTNEPTGRPSQSPSKKPTSQPSQSPSKKPTNQPSRSPSKQPTNQPTQSPSKQPSLAPSTAQPTPPPTPNPVTDSPTKEPTPAPSPAAPPPPPTPAPSTAEPSPPPTPKPVTDSPTKPALDPVTASPSKEPTSGPTSTPTVPVSPPTSKPTAVQVPPSAGPTPAQVPPPTSTPTLPTQPTPTQAPEQSSKPTSVVTSPTIPTTAKPTLSAAPVATPTVPTTKAPTPGGTQYPSQSSQPSDVDQLPTPPGPIPETPVDPPTPETPSVTPPTPAPPSPPSNDPDRGVGGSGEASGEEESESLGAGPIVGIVLASAFIGYAAAYLYVTRRKRETDDPELVDVRNKELDDDLEAGRAVESGPDDNRNDGSGEEKRGDSSYEGSLGGSLEDSARLRASDEAVFDGDMAAEYRIPQAGDSVAMRSPSTSPEKLLVTGIPSSPGRKTAKESDSSSAGESGWSSSAGLSSLNTASFDAGTDDGLLPGSPQRLMAAVGAANTATETAGAVQRDARPTFLPMDAESSRSSSYADTSYTESTGERIGSAPLRIHSGPTPELGRVTRDDLNAAIEAGDWAMVGATAALLASNNNGADESTVGSEPVQHSLGSSLAGSTRTESSASLDRARQLDRMVETGDWEGVVLAAAQFDGTNGLESEDATEASSKSEKTEDSKRKEEIRAEVELLVRRVVPDEIDNIGEMMIQFEGREEELIETLRTMQERSVAQRARAAVQKTAKLEAKAKASLSAPSATSSTTPTTPPAVKSSNASSSSSEPSFFGSVNESSLSDHSNRSGASSVSDLGMTSEDHTHTSSSKHSSSKKSTQSSLELAIERGDWRAVGEAAALMGDGTTSEILPDDYEMGSLSSSLTDPSAGKQQRVSHLDALIARGDWAGIVAAAGRYQAMDDHASGVEGLGFSPTQEEREALAQADMWQAIAEQSRQEGGLEATGAKDAADWAISRSLEQMSGGARAAVDDSSFSDSGDPDTKKQRIEDQESV